MKSSVAVVGMACRYPDASSPGELWDNVLAGRRAFRRIPAERLRLEDYFSADGRAEDSIYSTEGAFIEGYDFDRIRFRIAASTFRSADLTHWLALDVAAQALADAGAPEGVGLPRDSTGVFLGNTLTGEFSRANTLRLRWPYVKRVAEATLRARGMSAGECAEVLSELEDAYKRPFPAVDGETLAGGLSNTIAGRVCNHFDFKGGGYTVDGACASSLLAVMSACSALAAGDLDVALAGGVDLSVDPFELVGFAKAGALAKDEMRVYDRRSAGFWPGEGCGVAVLMRLADALATSRRVYAVVRGWGVSSDGGGGITRPEAEGQMLALGRAYRRAGYGVETVAYFEGHGTGTGVGDATELKALSEARRRANPEAPAAAIGSVKANIGHTKAAAGAAGLLKAVMALHTQTLPPTTGCEEPHAELTGERPALRVLRKGGRWPQELPLRAGVSAMGFGGINTHVTLEGHSETRRRTVSTRECALLSSAQDAELFLLAAPDRASLLGLIEKLSGFAPRLSRAELTDLAAALAGSPDDGARTWRAAVVASTPAELASRLQTLRLRVHDAAQNSADARDGLQLDPDGGVFFGRGGKAARVGLLFPGQAAPVYLAGGALGRRFEFVEELYRRARLPLGKDTRETALAQPSIVTASTAGLCVLDRLGVEARVAVGHSLGELAALHWAGAYGERTLLRIARLRARAMSEGEGARGKMISLRADSAQVEAMLNGDRVVISGFNSPRQTTVGGEAAAVEKFAARARALGYSVVSLNVAHAFHSPLMADAVSPLASGLAGEEFGPLNGRVISTVTGSALAAEVDVRELLCRQLTAPVRFVEAATAAASEVDFFIEVGPGQILANLVKEFLDKPCVPLDAGGESLRGTLKAAGAAFAAGACADMSLLFAGRYAKPFSLDWRPRFFVNPCELAPEVGAPRADLKAGDAPAAEGANDASSGASQGEVAFEAQAGAAGESALELVRRLVAERAELPADAVRAEHTLLGDLHLNSITVSQLVVEAARSLGLPPPVAPTEYAHATVAEVAAALEDLDASGAQAPVEQHPSGVDAWIRGFTVEWVEQPLPVGAESKGGGAWNVFAPEGHPLASPLRDAFARLGGGSGTIICIPPDADERHVALLLQGVRAFASDEGATHFVLVQHLRGAAALARTLKMETPRACVCVVNVPHGDPRAVEWVTAEVRAADGYVEVRYDEDGVRRVPLLRLLPPAPETSEAPLGPEDVLLVTGGGKGIAAECALALARETGARLALLGRSRPEDDTELSTNLVRIASAGIAFRYYAADVTDEAAVRDAVAQAEAELGPVTALLHGAGLNTPRLLAELDEETFLRTLAPKVRGARNVLAALDPERLRLLVTFGSVIARTGMRGEADYALANEWLTELTDDWGRAHKACRCLAVEWSVWSGVGMGQRLGRVDALAQQGITPIPADEGVRVLRRLLGRPSAPAAVVVTGRFGDPPTLQVERPALPLLRFLEECRVFYPGVELVVEATLSEESDPYLREHVFRGEQLFPAVLGLEAMAQAATALKGEARPPSFSEVKFERPVAVPRGGSVTIRVAALARETGEVAVALRSEQTAFQVDHFRAVCRFDHPTPADDSFGCEEAAAGMARVALEPARDLYGSLLFHEGRFRRLRGYRRLGATACVAEVGPDEGSQWFGRYLPGGLLLGDPGRRDATIHAIQACVPDATILPAGVERVEVACVEAAAACVVSAREREFDGRTFTYDVQVHDAGGRLLERWVGLRLRVIEGAAFRGRLPAPLLGPYVERRINEALGGAVHVAVAQDASVTGRRVSTDRAARSLLAPGVKVVRRPDGKPELAAPMGLHLSASHSHDLTLVVAGARGVACDVEAVEARAAGVWRDLLGAESFTLAEEAARLTGEAFHSAATRVWSAKECMKKAGAPACAPLTLGRAGGGRWLTFESPACSVQTYSAELPGREGGFIFAVLAESASRDTDEGGRAPLKVPSPAVPRCEDARL